jgi:transcription termination factor Rho
MCGGMDSRVLERVRQGFSLARDFDERDTLSIFVSQLIETGNKMDNLTFQEFKGIDNAEIVLNKMLAVQRTRQTFDVKELVAGREEQIFSPNLETKVDKRACHTVSSHCLSMQFLFDYQRSQTSFAGEHGFLKLIRKSLDMMSIISLEANL